tara:strand:+ start:1005 stop:1424 length:420 start_codon:yes stop_codon:yes gene_type:complete
MKTFKQHINEEGEGIGTHDQNSVEDGSMGAHNVHDPDVLKRVNAFVGSVAMKEYLNPQQAVDELRNKLMRIGLNFEANIEGDKGTTTVDVSRFKTFGKSDDGQDIDNDGISDVKEGGLKLEIKHELLQNGTSKVYAKLI